MAGSQSVTLVSSHSCDSVATLNLTVNSNITSTTNLSICQNSLPYTWNGLIFNVAGTQSVMLVSSQGCDSLVTLNLSVNTSVSSTTNLSICQNALPYSWNGLTFTTAGSQVATMASSQGCDSLATLNLTVNPNVSSTTNITICQNLLPYTWNGLTFNMAGSQVATLASSLGCDSMATLNLTVNPNVSSTTNIAINQNALPYTWNGFILTMAGSQTVTLISSRGCDSIATLKLTVNANVSSTTNLTICQNALPYIWNGFTFNGPGSHTTTFTSYLGTDSLANLNLTVSPNLSSTTNVTVCNNQLPYLWNGIIMNATGSQSVTLPSSLDCDSIATLNLSVTNVITPIFNAINPFCSGSIAPVLPNISNNGISGTWFPSVVSNTSTGIYTFTPNIGQCATSVQRTVTVESVVITNLSSNSPICSGNTLNLFASGGDSYEWSGPNSFAVTFQNPIRTNATIAMSGVYVVTVTSVAGCSSTASVNVLVNPRPVVTIGSNSPVCAGNSILLTSGGGTGYSWSGPNAFSNNLQNPTLPTVTVSAGGNYIVTVTGTGGCTSTSQILVTVNANPVATAGSNSPICEGATLNLTSAGGTSYSWNGPNSFTNLTQNPSITTVPITAVGTYTVTVTGIGNCTSTAQTTVAVNSLPIPSINGDTVLCPGENTTLTASGGVSYVWSNGSLLATNDVSPIVSTTYVVTVTSQFGCTQTASVFVSRVTNPVISMIDSIIETCSAVNGSLQITVTDGTQPYHYNWNNGGGDVSMIDSLSSSIYTVTVTDEAGCTVIQSIPLSNSPSPTLTIVSTIDDHCFKGIGGATVIATGGTGSYSYSWNTQPEQLSASTTHLISGAYMAKVNDGNCTDSVEVIVGNIPGPTAEFDSDRDTAFISNPKIRFINESIGGTSYSWTFGDGEQSLQENPSHTYVNSQDYIVTLQVVDEYGCTDTVSHAITILEEVYLFIPNTFSPDGDGLNDVFKPVGAGYSLTGYELNIYSRWGDLVFHTLDINEGWDGTVKGELVNFKSVFVYKIEVCGYTGKKHQYSGHITVFAY